MKTDYKDLEKLEKKEDYAEVIKTVRKLVAKDPRVLTDPFIKRWCGRRYRNLFISEAVKDRAAVKTAGKFLKIGRDKRSDRQKIAERFLKGKEIQEWQVGMPKPKVDKPKETTLIFCPGLINGLLPVRAFPEEFPVLEKKTGWKIMRTDSHPMRSCKANIADIVPTIDKGKGFDAGMKPLKHAKPPKDIILMGYSKGSPDVLRLLADRPDLAPRIRCFISWAGAVGGSYTADGIYSFIKDTPTEAVTKRLDDFLAMVSPGSREHGALRRLEEYDIKGALLDLTTHEREAFMKKHYKAIDALNVPIFNFTGATTPLEVAHFQIQDTLNLNRYDANNDMQLTQAQAKVSIPMATDLAMFHANHWDLSYSPFPRSKRMGSPNLDHPFPRLAAVTAIYLFLAELGLAT